MTEARDDARPPTEPRDDTHATHALAKVRDALAGLRYGQVTVIVQDGVIVQVERTEKLRLARQ